MGKLKVVAVAAAGIVVFAALAGSAGVVFGAASVRSAVNAQAAEAQPSSSARAPLLAPTPSPTLSAPTATPSPVVAAKPVVRHTAVQPGAVSTRTPSRPALHTVYVWTTGFQTQLNACRGGVDLTARYGVRTVGEKWGCGGASFPTAKGTLVRMTGHDAGTYRVIGVVAVLNAYVANTSQVPRGYAMLFQTCRGNNARYTEFIALSRA